MLNFINNFNDNSVNHGPLNNDHCAFNPIEKVIELYDYTYDSFGQLEVVKDENENILVLFTYMQ